MQKASFTIAEMSCAGCVNGVTAVLKRLDGVCVEHVKIGSAEVAFDPGQTSPVAIAEALSTAGYPAKPVGEPVGERVGEPGV